MLDNAKLQEKSVCNFSYFFDMSFGHNCPQTHFLRKHLIKFVGLLKNHFPTKVWTKT